MRGWSRLGVGALFAAAAAAACACGEAGDASRDRDVAGREREHPDWSSPEDEVDPADAKAPAAPGGIERVGGTWIFPVDVSAAADLPPETARIVAAQIEAARFGDDIAFAERGRESLRAKSTLERILVHGERLPAKMRSSIERYLLGFYVHHGSAPGTACGASTNGAGLLRPDFIPGELAAAAEIAAQGGAVFDIPKGPDTLGANRLQELEALMTAIRPTVFGRFVARTGPDSPDAGAAIRIAGPAPADASRGGRPAEVAALVDSLRALVEEQKLGPPSAGRTDAQLLSPEPGVLSVVGFEAADRGGAFRGLVGLPEPKGQELLDAVFAKAAALDKIVRSAGGTKSVTEAAAPRARVRAVAALYASGALGPMFGDGSLWRMIDGPSVRVSARGGDELWLLTNAAASFDASFGAALAGAFSRDAATGALRMTRRARTRLAINALREAAGRGTDGTETRSAEWLGTHLGRYAPLMAAMRADLAALYLALDPAVLEARLVDGEEGARAVYEDYVGWTFESYGFGVPPVDLADAAEARRAVVRNLAAAGAVTVKGGDGGAVLTYELADARAVRAAVAALLAEVRRIRFVGDAKAAAALADSFRSSEARWQREIEARYRRLERPRCAGFSFPQLVAETGADGKAEKLRLGKGEGYVSGRIAALRKMNVH